MAEIGHAIVETNSVDTTTSTSFTHVGSAGEHEIQGSSLDGSTNYILLAHALHGGSSTSNNQIYMNLTENGVGALANSEQRAESRRNGGSSGVHYGFLDKITTASTPSDYQIQMKSNGSETSSVTGSWLCMIDLDDLTTDQWKYAEVDTDDTSISTSTETGASVTLGEGDWLIFAFTRWDMNSNSDAVEFQIDIDGNNKAFTRYEARDTTEVSCMLTMTAYTVSGDSVTASVEYSSEGTAPDLLNSRIFAIDMNAFQDHAFKQKAKGVSTTNISAHDTNFTVDTLSHTSSTGSARDWAVFSHLTWDVASTQARMMNAIDQGGTQIIGETNASANSAPEQGQHDGADECALLLFGELSSHAHNTDLDLDLVVMDNDSPGNGGVDENTIAAFTWELVNNVNVSASTETLTVATPQASVALDVDVQASRASLTLAAQQASIANDVNVTTNVEALTLAEQQASIAVDVDVSASTSALTLQEQQASIAVDVDVATSLAELTIATHQATVTEGEVEETPAKSKGRRKRKRYIVEIDNQFIEVASVADAQAVLEQAREVAEDAATQLTEPVKDIPRISVKLISGKETRSKVLRRDVKKTQQAVEWIYRKAQQRIDRDREISRLLQARIRDEEEDEEALIALLM